MICFSKSLQRKEKVQCNYKLKPRRLKSKRELCTINESLPFFSSHDSQWIPRTLATFCLCCCALSCLHRDTDTPGPRLPSQDWPSQICDLKSDHVHRAKGDSWIQAKQDETRQDTAGLNFQTRSAEMKFRHEPSSILWNNIMKIF